MEKRRYLGDGVYARFDGYQVWLAANNHHNEVIAIEPEVLKSLNEFYEDMKKQQS